MRNYYYNEENFTVYTEREMEKSRNFARCWFAKIGQFKNRAQAEDAFRAKHPDYPIDDEPRN